MLDLEPLDSGLCSRPEQSVDWAGFVPEARQHPLYLENARCAAGAPVAGTWAKGRRGPKLPNGGMQRGLRLLANDAVRRQAMRLLEAPNRPLRQRTVDAIDRASRVGPIA